jgi:ferritin-like metal-binding protein YciE
MSTLSSSDLMKQKFILLLNGALAMENAGIERLQTRISETIIPEAKQQLQHHSEESQNHIERLNQLITSLGGQPYQGKMELPIPGYPQDILQMMNDTMTKEEWELKRSEEDVIVENAEAKCYLMLIQKAQKAGGIFQNAVEPLTLNLNDEQKMVDWIKTKSPDLLNQLWPSIESSTIMA